LLAPKQKRAITMENLKPGGSQIAVARRHGMRSGPLDVWRRQLVEARVKARLPVPLLRTVSGAME